MCYEYTPFAAKCKKDLDGLIEEGAIEECTHSAKAKGSFS